MKIIPDVVFLFVNSVGRAALNSSIKPGVLLPWENEIERYVRANGKFSKFNVAYIPIPILPPLAWDYKCFKCKYWVEPDSCSTVDGVIDRRGWCSIWIPPPTYKAFSWPKELLKGDW